MTRPDPARRSPRLVHYFGAKGVRAQHIGLLTILLVFAACSKSSETDRGDRGTPDGGAGQVCVPDVLRCVEDAEAVGWDRETCAEDGASWVAAPCGEHERCVEPGICEPFECIPGERRCAADGSIEECLADGTGWVLVDDGCEATEVCQGGTCLNMCEHANERRSYDGCDFFAVDLPQYATAYDRFDWHPFAVVLANPHDVAAHVTITSENAHVVTLVAMQEVVEPEFAMLGEEPRTTIVYSEVQDAAGVITHISGRAAGVEIPPGGMGTFILPNQSVGISTVGNVPIYENEFSSKAFRVVTDVPVTAYQFQPICCSQSFTNDATILFPVGSLGREYRAVSLPMFINIPGYIAIVGGAEPADVQVHLGSHQFSATDGVTYNNGVVSARMGPYDVLTLFGRGYGAASTDLSGVKIEATADVAVFGGHTCTNVPHDFFACDHLESILMPVESWRAEYVGAHTYFRSSEPTEVNYYRVMSAENPTRIEIDPPFDALSAVDPVANGLPRCHDFLDNGDIVLNGEEWCEFGTRQSFYLQGTEPFQFIQLLTGSQTAMRIETLEAPDPEDEAPDDADEDDAGGDTGEDDGGTGEDDGGTGEDDGGTGEDEIIPDEVQVQIGDPALTMVPPTAQYRMNYTFLTPETFEYNYVNVIHAVGSDIFLDGVLISEAELDGEIMKVHEEAIGSSSWHLTIMRIPSGPHFIASARDDRFGIMVYAYDRDVSYAFPGGLDLDKL